MTPCWRLLWFFFIRLFSPPINLPFHYIFFYFLWFTIILILFLFSRSLLMGFFFFPPCTSFCFQKEKLYLVFYRLCFRPCVTNREIYLLSSNLSIVIFVWISYNWNVYTLYRYNTKHKQIRPISYPFFSSLHSYIYLYVCINFKNILKKWY